MTDATLEVRFRLARPLRDDELDGVIDKMNDLIDPDAVYEAIGDTAFISIGTSSTGNHVEDAERLIQNLSSLGIDIADVDDDLVNLSDIAARAGVDKETARTWARGSRMAGPPFPSPVAFLGGGVCIWDWPSVNGWLGRVKGGEYHDGIERLSRVERAELTLRLEARRSAATSNIRNMWTEALEHVRSHDLVYMDTGVVIQLKESFAEVALEPANVERWSGWKRDRV